MNDEIGRDLSDDMAWFRVPSWWEAARCRHLGVDLRADGSIDYAFDNPWFPDRGGGDKTGPLIARCWGVGPYLGTGPCPSRLACLAAGLDADLPIPSGVFGGHSVRDRRRIRKLVEAGTTLREASAQVRAVKIRRRSSAKSDE